VLRSIQALPVQLSRQPFRVRLSRRAFRIRHSRQAQLPQGRSGLPSTGIGMTRPVLRQPRGPRSSRVRLSRVRFHRDRLNRQARPRQEKSGLLSTDTGTTHQRNKKGISSIALAGAESQSTIPNTHWLPQFGHFLVRVVCVGQPARLSLFALRPLVRATTWQVVGHQATPAFARLNTTDAVGGSFIPSLQHFRRVPLGSHQRRLVGLPLDPCVSSALSAGC
jgi:hypothetical protein